MTDNQFFNMNDTMDINELVSLNDDISPELIEQLQQKLTQDLAGGSAAVPEAADMPEVVNENDDTTLFEEPKAPEIPEIPAAEVNPEPKQPVKLQQNFDDNFIKKYKAKLNKQQVSDVKPNEDHTISNAAFSGIEEIPKPIEEISNGNISEKPLTQEQKDYNDSLDFLDGNVKYSKYVIYVDPKNVDFIDSLTVKERKNLINKILREQDDIAITRKRFRKMQAIIKHAVIAILTIAISIPVIYFTINASLEASINNYRRSLSNFEILYKENGKITRN